ncbi:MAG: DUF554 domain-containing protein [Bacteroidota bacterium]|nr:DUF554 domain-containing protein [Flavobacteriales bacterium]MEC7950885.1 DUF554 domain-containing protein [Bacteroidota bacterium]OUU17662.1 MAG: hypothetical protein CBC05_04895 [Crocinitomicaceae bacterium TMED45]MEC8399689.1 DUF554 domain-containing protein [Bacteroidota bacterium]MED5317702.1 DUF554 domain-containing protein [Bacteroidota bacterium]|tara:strand:- start:2008 stop:2688 length:681 start_codon:yes stop_codon:yes gene_type:complete
MVGTLFNTFAVAVGASAGLALGARWSSELKDKMFVVLGLFTLAIGSMMALETAQPIDLFLALVFGTLLGHSLKLQARLSELTQPKDGATAGRGFVEAMILFCLGSMTLVGCMEDGLLNKPNLLFIKGTMDLISSAFLAATLGRGVLWSAVGVLVFQGGLTLAFGFMGQGMSPELIQELSALGGILMLGIGFQLLGVRAHNLPQWPLVDALPALALLPLIRMAHELL